MAASKQFRSNSQDWPRSVLWAHIDALLAGEITVPEFEARYYDFYVEEVPDDALSNREREFFGYVQEKLDWTSDRPTAEDRRCGWIDHLEYVEWLRRQRRRFNAGEAIEFR